MGGDEHLYDLFRGEAVPLSLPPTRLVGRSRELAAVGDLLSSGGARLVTLTGPAGVGKTRLALELAHRSNRAVLVTLAAVRDRGEVPPAVLRALGVERAGADPARSLIAALRDRGLLLVLDNFEHLLEASPLVADVIAACPGVTVLITSRAALRLLAERVFPLGPLTLPEPGLAPTPHAASGYGAVALFAERVAAVVPGFTLTVSTVPAVVTICARLEGLPLALELAAARARVLTLEAIAAGLDEQLGMLGGGLRDLPARQRTMRDALAWSWRLLDADAAAVLARLAVCVGGCSLAAVTDICAPLAGPGRVLDLLDELVAHSLIAPDHSGPEPRYRLLEVVREFAAERLDEAARESARDLHARHYSEVAERVAAELASGRYGNQLDRLERERFNMQAAVERFVECGEGEAAQRLCMWLRSLWYVRGPLASGRALFAAALALPGATDATRARASAEASALARQHGDRQAADELAAEAVLLARRTGDSRLLAHCLLQQGFNAHLSERFELAHEVLEESLAVAVARGDELGAALARHHLGFAAYFGAGEIERAYQLELDCLATFRRLERERQIATTLFALTELARARREQRTSQAYLEEASEIIAHLSDWPLLVSLLAPAAALAADRHRYERALSLLGAAEALQRTTSSPTWLTLARTTSAWIPRAERAVGARQAATLRRHGGRLPLPKLIELLRDPDSRGAPLDPLTAREREIAAHLGAGETNRQIAAALVISERTVDGHVANILRKLGFRTRSQIAAWVASEQVPSNR
jgi:non-specific serine/threonine protein kinase